MRISDWSSDVCSSDLQPAVDRIGRRLQPRDADRGGAADRPGPVAGGGVRAPVRRVAGADGQPGAGRAHGRAAGAAAGRMARSEEHTSELQSLMRISYAVFCLRKKIKECTVIRNTLLD